MAEYYPITRDEMEDLLYNELDFPSQHNPLKIDGTTELVYGRGFKLGDTPIALRVYSSIWPTGEARTKGGDSIKVCLLVKRPDGEIRAIGKAKRVHRVKGWRKNLTQRIADVVKSISSIVRCPKCGLPMAKRKGKQSEFMGCSDFPNCKGTRNIT
jgi:hypothetical protein|tara:strand:- start:329 stop:793 length:465 start_codon:yes stop_codon:yes gene_type:complete